MNRVIWCTPGRADEAPWIVDVTNRGFSVVRRCVDAADLLAAASIDVDASVVVDVDTPRLGADIVAAIPGAPTRTVVALASDERGVALARSWGLIEVIEGSDAHMVDRIATVLRRGATTSASSQDAAVPGIGIDRPPTRGDLVVVYGSAGAPGRSTIALGLAESCARAGQRVCLIDADTLAPSLASLVGMTEDVSGVLIAARYADQGSLDARSLGSACRKLDESLWLMTGITDKERWTHLRPAALQRVWHTCLEHFDRVIVDTNSLLHGVQVDDPLSSAVPARDSATVSALRSSDAVVMVTKADPLSLTRLLGDLHSVRALIGHPRVSVVVNRVPKKSVALRSRVEGVLAHTGCAYPVFAVPEDRSVARCVESGALIFESGATGRVRRSLAKVREALAA